MHKIPQFSHYYRENERKIKTASHKIQLSFLKFTLLIARLDRKNKNSITKSNNNSNNNNNNINNNSSINNQIVVIIKVSH